MDTLQQQQKTKRSSFLANVPTQRRIDEDEKRNNNYRSSVNDIQVEASISSGYSSKRSSFAGYRRPTSISSIHNLTNNNNSRYSRNSFLGDDSVDYVSLLVWLLLFINKNTHRTMTIMNKMKIGKLFLSNMIDMG